MGPDYLPGHAHADTLSFEWSLFGQRVLVNSGTSEYGLSPERLRQRGTTAIEPSTWHPEFGLSVPNQRLAVTFDQPVVETVFRY